MADHHRCVAADESGTAVVSSTEVCSSRQKWYSSGQLSRGVQQQTTVVQQWPAQQRCIAADKSGQLSRGVQQQTTVVQQWPAQQRCVAADDSKTVEIQQTRVATLAEVCSSRRQWYSSGHFSRGVQQQTTVVQQWRPQQRCVAAHDSHGTAVASLAEVCSSTRQWYRRVQYSVGPITIF